MHVFLLACAWLVGVAATSSGILEGHQVFPLNDTYAPMEYFPLIFAFKNSELLQFTAPWISFQIWDRDNNTDTVITGSFDLSWKNFSIGDPYFAYHGYKHFNREGRWALVWQLVFTTCAEEPDMFTSKKYINNGTEGFVHFTTNNSAKQVDLVAATDNGGSSDNCPINAISLNVTKTRKVPTRGWDGTGETCAVLASSSDIPHPCGIKIDATSASSISASITAWYNCESTPRRIDCPIENDKEDGTARTMVAGIALWVATMVAFGYILL